MKELYYVYSTTMSLGLGGVFQLVKKVTYRRRIAFQADSVHFGRSHNNVGSSE